MFGERVVNTTNAQAIEIPDNIRNEDTTTSASWNSSWPDMSSVFSFLQLGGVNGRESEDGTGSGQGSAVVFTKKQIIVGGSGAPTGDRVVFSSSGRTEQVEYGHGGGPSSTKAASASSVEKATGTVVKAPAPVAKEDARCPGRKLDPACCEIEQNVDALFQELDEKWVKEGRKGEEEGKVLFASPPFYFKIFVAVRPSGADKNENNNNGRDGFSYLDEHRDVIEQGGDISKVRTVVKVYFANEMGKARMNDATQRMEFSWRRCIQFWNFHDIVTPKAHPDPPLLT